MVLPCSMWFLLQQPGTMVQVKREGDGHTWARQLAVGLYGQRQWHP